MKILHLRTSSETDGNNPTVWTNICCTSTALSPYNIRISWKTSLGLRRCHKQLLCYIIFQTGITSAYTESPLLSVSWLSAIHIRRGVVATWSYLLWPIPLPFDLWWHRPTPCTSTCDLVFLLNPQLHHVLRQPTACVMFATIGLTFEGQKVKGGGEAESLQSQDGPLQKTNHTWF